MDFMKLLKLLEELLYEMVSWLVFYRITMWRSSVGPFRMMQYADDELADRPESPSYPSDRTCGFQRPSLDLCGRSPSRAPFINRQSPAARGVISGVLPLVMAVTLVKRKKIRLTRETLRPPFYSQCYVASLFVLFAGFGLDLILIPHQSGLAAGIGVVAVATIWYGLAQVRWFRYDLAISTAAGVVLFVGRLLVAILVIIALALVIAWH
ncbi:MULTISPECIES: permease [unclassified Rhizobium]|uniref:permease n=1 Tax=unclassified Rhizobium TaxID=2613769 RepID=UPI001FCD85D9|nr:MULTISPECIES: permease [unclassified Rhizobium]MDM9623310.1 permease [Rhizobium sp. S96]